jgi:hypothetical protein
METLTRSFFINKVTSTTKTQVKDQIQNAPKKKRPNSNLSIKPNNIIISWTKCFIINNIITNNWYDDDDYNDDMLMTTHKQIALCWLSYENEEKLKDSHVTAQL